MSRLSGRETLRLICGELRIPVVDVESGRRYREASEARRRFARAMRAQGWTLERIARAVGVGHSSIARAVESAQEGKIV